MSYTVREIHELINKMETLANECMSMAAQDDHAAYTAPNKRVAVLCRELGALDRERAQVFIAMGNAYRDLLNPPTSETAS